MIKRIFVEKKTDPQKEKLIADIKEMLGIDCSGMRRLHRYDTEGISDEIMKRAAIIVFSEPPLDNHFETLTLGENETALVTEYLEGQFDQRADSAAQCIQFLSGGAKPVVRYATVYVFQNITAENLARIKGYIINPIDTKEGSMELPKMLKTTVPSEGAMRVEIDGFTDMNLTDLNTFYHSFGFACTIDDLVFIQHYFKGEQRNPTLTELKAIDTYWSDHCRHTTFLTEITDVKIHSGNPHIEKSWKKYQKMFKEYNRGRADKYPCLMDIVTIAVKELKKKGLLDNLDESDEVNACSIQVTVDVDGQPQEWLIMFKNETHNHPTEIEPYGGASTCLGGAIRDPLSGRVYVYQGMRVTGAGNPLEKLEETMPGKLPQRVIAKTAANGFSSYGNQIGVATGLVAEFYHDRYKAKRMEAGYVIGAAPKANVVRRKPQAGDIVLLVGGDTGRDGCGGATGSSKSHSEESVEICGAEVQKGNPPEERKIQRLFRNPEAAKLIVKCNDFGAGGVSVAIGELAEGVDVFLDRIRKKYDGMTATELAISESQERMAVIVSSEDEELFVSLAAKENLYATPVAVVTDLSRLRMFYGPEIVVDIARGFLDTNGVKQTTQAEIHDNYTGFLTQADEETVGLIKEKQYKTAIENELKKLNACSKKGMGEMFDSTVGAATVLMPYGGKTQLTPANVMAARPPVSGVTHTVTCSAWAYYPELTIQSPYVGTVHSIISAVSKLVSCGVKPEAIRLSLQEFFKKLGKDPLRWGEPLSAMLAAMETQSSLEIAAIGGKDSMSGSFGPLDVPPTVVAFGCGITSDTNIIHNVFPNKGYVTHIKLPRDSYGMPDFAQVKSIYGRIAALIENKTVTHSTVVEDGGRITALLKSLMGDNSGVVIDTPAAEDFFPLYGDLLVVSKNKLENEKPFGILNDSGSVIIEGESFPVADFAKAFCSTLEPVFPSVASVEGEARDLMYEARPKFRNRIHMAKPRVIIPAFPGTNCEYDTARAFRNAGAAVKTCVFRNRTAAEIEESIDNLFQIINNSQILVFPGGFSGGDEPDGSGKFFAATFNHPKLAEALNNLLSKRDGLVLGICNGFQALLKMGLLPYGTVGAQKSDSPTLTNNAIGRHVSTICQIRVASNNSPWLSATEAGQIYSVPVSHGEGRFVCNDAHLKLLVKNNQIATQYVDPEGKPTMQSPYNPNGSVCAVEGLFSPDGRIFGKMGHAERWVDGNFQNVPGNYNMPIFESGVRYFK